MAQEPNTYQVGDVVRVRTSTPFTDIEGTVFDPAKVVFMWKQAGQDATSVNSVDDPAQVEKVATGDFYVDVPVTNSGDWYYRVEGRDGSDGFLGAAEGLFHAEDSLFD